jgi:subtilisin family serine protease
VFLITLFNVVAYCSLTADQNQTPWYIEAIGADRCKNLSTGRGSMVMIIDKHDNPFAVANNITPLKGKVYYIDVEGKTFFDHVPVENNIPCFHATAIAGLIAGETLLLPYIYDDGTKSHLKSLPISGVAPGSKIVYVGTRLTNAPLYAQALNSMYTFDIVKNLTMVDQGGTEINIFNPNQLTNIINLSIGDIFKVSSKKYQDNKVGWDEALGIAENKNTLLVIAAGNDGINFDDVLAQHYVPQEIRNKKNIILVAAITQHNLLSKESNRSPQLVDIAAPGENISVVRPDNLGDIRSGTSYAAPLVAGTLALGLECNPFITPKELKELLLKEAKSYEHLKKDVLNGKVLDAYSFVKKTCRPQKRFSLTPVHNRKSDKTAERSEL